MNYYATLKGWHLGFSVNITLQFEDDISFVLALSPSTSRSWKRVTGVQEEGTLFAIKVASECCVFDAIDLKI